MTKTAQIKHVNIHDMREIKFRVWDNAHQTMKKVREVCFDQYGGVDVYAECDSINERAKGKNDLMQYTGLTDKNSQEIYEHDVLEWNGGFGRSLVVWLDSGCWGTSQGNALGRAAEVAPEMAGHGLQPS